MTTLPDLCAGVLVRWHAHVSDRAGIRADVTSDGEPIKLYAGIDLEAV